MHLLGFHHRPVVIKEERESFKGVLTDRGISIGVATRPDGELEEETGYIEML